jgi:hypothetical protein
MLSFELGDDTIREAAHIGEEDVQESEDDASEQDDDEFMEDPDMYGR